MTEKQKMRDVKIKFTQEEYDQLAALKDEHELTFTDLVRFLMLGPHTVKKLPDRKALGAILAELNKLGSNVNQIARAYNYNPNGTHMTDKDFARIQQNIQAVKDYIAKAVRL
jgi:hypothetical protein